MPRTTLDSAQRLARWIALATAAVTLGSQLVRLLEELRRLVLSW